MDKLIGVPGIYEGYSNHTITDFVLLSRKQLFLLHSFLCSQRFTIQFKTLELILWTGVLNNDTFKHKVFMNEIRNTGYTYKTVKCIRNSTIKLQEL